VVKRPTPAQTRLAAKRIGAQLTAWRKLYGLTAAQVAERADVSRSTLRRLEQGEAAMGLDSFLNVCRSLGVLDAVVKATDPYETDFGRARADQMLPKRVRQ